MNNIQSTEEIYQSLLATFMRESGITLQEHGEMAVRLYAIAAQIHGMQYQVHWTLEQCFPHTASGSYLDKHAFVRGLSRREATFARGKIRFSLDTTQTTAVDIPEGTVCMTAGTVRFATLESASIPAGESSVEVPAEALAEGEGSNVLAGSIRIMAVAPVGIASCSNPEAFTGGAQTEDDSQLRERILDSYQRMPNGANVAYYEREALSVPQVAAVNVIPRARGRGTVDIIVSSVQGQPETALVEAVQAHLQKQREIAVDVKTRAPEEISLSLEVYLTLKSGVLAPPIVEAVKETLSTHFDGRQLGQSVLLAKLGQLIFAVDGVENYHIVSPAEDVLVQRGQLPRLDDLQVEVRA